MHWQHKVPFQSVLLRFSSDSLHLVRNDSTLCGILFFVLILGKNWDPQTCSCLLKREKKNDSPAIRFCFNLDHYFCREPVRGNNGERRGWVSVHNLQILPPTPHELVHRNRHFRETHSSSFPSEGPPLTPRRRTVHCRSASDTHCCDC